MPPPRRSEKGSRSSSENPISWATGRNKPTKRIFGRSMEAQPRTLETLGVLKSCGVARPAGTNFLGVSACATDRFRPPNRDPWDRLRGHVLGENGPCGRPAGAVAVPGAPETWPTLWSDRGLHRTTSGQPLGGPPPPHGAKTHVQRAEARVHAHPRPPKTTRRTPNDPQVRPDAWGRGRATVVVPPPRYGPPRRTWDEQSYPATRWIAGRESVRTRNEVVELFYATKTGRCTEIAAGLANSSHVSAFSLLVKPSPPLGGNLRPRTRGVCATVSPAGGEGVCRVSK